MIGIYYNEHLKINNVLELKKQLRDRNKDTGNGIHPGYFNNSRYHIWY